MHSHQSNPGSDRPVIIAIGLLIAVYAVATAYGITEAHHGQDAHGAADAVAHEDQHSAHDAGSTMPHFYAVAPFVLLLGAIAVFPIVPAIEHWWESNFNRFCVAAGLAIVTLLYYLFLHAQSGLITAVRILDHAILQEYIPFIVLLFSLYTISGGIRIEGDLPAHPGTNCGFLMLGGLLASFIGTTGAAMLLIRPLLDTNQERQHVQHTVVFFIFVVCNCGGCLLPIGDPPLFLGYLAGVDFLWTLWNLWPAWLCVNAIIIGAYFVLDRFWYYPQETKVDIRRDEQVIRPLRISGLWPNAALLVGVILSVALLDPKTAVPGTDWHPWLYLREVVQLLLVALSLGFGSVKVRAANSFNYHAILEVAALFVGIFICMQPAIEILHVKGPSLGIDVPDKFFWTTGSLSSVLDNAPTYVVFFETADALHPDHDFASLVSQTGETANWARLQLIGISLGAVFMGSMTYIGNGPNFMVRAIAEQSGIRMPSFFGYVVRYSVPVLIPIFWLATVLFV